MKEIEKVISWWKINLGKDEVKNIKGAISNRYVTQGVLTEKLERHLAEILNVPYVVLTTNGSSALLMALIALGIKPGDEVIIPDLTFVATAQAPLLLGAKVRLIDVKPRKPVIDVNKIEEAITSKTKVIIPVHLNGRAADIKNINKIAAKYNLKVIEDCAQAFCSKNSFGYLGTQSDVGVFSLGIAKLITTIQGGFLATRDESLFKRLKKIRNHGLSSYTPDFSDPDILGFNFKFNDVLASVGLSQIKKLKEKIEVQKDIYYFYKRLFKDLDYIEMLDVDIEKGELPLWIEAVSMKRDRLITLLRDRYIEAKPFYPALSDIPYLSGQGDFYYSKFYGNHGLVLPSGSGQSRQNLKQVAKALKEISPVFKIKSKNR